jgi:hypothetical protein
LAAVAQAGPIVVVGLVKREIDQVVYHKKQGNAYRPEGRQVIFVRIAQQKAKAHPVEDRECEIVGLDGIFPEFILEFSEALLLHKDNCNSHGEYGEIGDDRAG